VVAETFLKIFYPTYFRATVCPRIIMQAGVVQKPEGKHTVSKADVLFLQRLALAGLDRLSEALIVGR